MTDPTTPSAFTSVKLPAALVQRARDAAQPLRRSAAGQIEYWATLGQVVEHSGLTVQEAQTAIERYEAAARDARAKTQVAAVSEAPDALEALKRRVLEVSTNGVLQAHIQRVVQENRQQGLRPAGGVGDKAAA